jgi:hypothetical protein
MEEQEKVDMPDTFATDGVSTIYSNHASLTMSFNDARIYFSEIGPAAVGLTSTNEPKHLKGAIRPLVSVAMAPEQLKVLGDAIANTLKIYEKQFGPLRTPPPGLGIATNGKK